MNNQNVYHEQASDKEVLLISYRYPPSTMMVNMKFFPEEFFQRLKQIDESVWNAEISPCATLSRDDRLYLSERDDGFLFRSAQHRKQDFILTEYHVAHPCALSVTESITLRKGSRCFSHRSPGAGIRFPVFVYYQTSHGIFRS